MGTVTRARVKKQQAPAQEEDTSTNTQADGAQLDLLIAEQCRQRDEVSMLAQKAAAAEERAFHMTATIKELQQEMRIIREKLYDTRSRLTAAERNCRKMDDTMRASTRGSIEEIKDHVQKLQQKNSSPNAGQSMRAASMVSDIDDVRSEVSTTLSASTRGYVHSSLESALAALQR